MNATMQQQALGIKNACVEFIFAYQQKNVAKMLSVCNPEGQVHFLPLGEAGQGRIMELGKNLWESLIDAFPDLDNTLDAAVAEGNQTVRCQVVIRGTQQKAFAGIPSKGKAFESDHIFIFHLNDNQQIDAISISWDHADFSKQLGA